MSSKRKIIYWSLLIAWMILIFVMSNQPAKVSDSQSIGALDLFLKLGINLNGIFGDLANFIIRKCAHFLEYMILALLSFNVLKLYFSIKQVSTITIIFVFLYACSDEIHQLFVLGREGAIRDVIIDTCGGIVLVSIRLGIICKKKFTIKNKIRTKLE
jgi:VanZ family protein